MGKFTKTFGNLTVVLGAQWGDEGKGKLVDILAEEYDIIVRATGGANAGHTIYTPKKFIFHLIPSGMMQKDKICVIGNGVVVHIPTLIEELKILKENGISTQNRLLISDRAHIVLEQHKMLDAAQEEERGKNQVGTTKRGIGPAYMDKIKRSGTRMHHLIETNNHPQKNNQELKEEDVKTIIPMLTDTSLYLNHALDEGKNILVEGANGTLLDIDHGTYPYVTSSNASIGGAVAGTGISALKFKSAIGIMKAYVTRVGAGPFPTELKNDLGNKIREQGGEYGSTTGRPRRCGWFDAVVGKYSCQINAYTAINLTKLDVLTGIPTLKIATAYTHKGKKLESFPASLETLENIEIAYEEMPGWQEDISKAQKFEDLPENAQKYIKRIEELIDCQITFIGVGPQREQMIIRL